MCALLAYCYLTTQGVGYRKGRVQADPGGPHGSCRVCRHYPGRSHGHIIGITGQDCAVCSLVAGWCLFMSCGVCVRSACGLCFCLVCNIGVPVLLICGMSVCDCRSVCVRRVFVVCSCRVICREEECCRVPWYLYGGVIFRFWIGLS